MILLQDYLMLLFRSLRPERALAAFVARLELLS
jgi:hypothetical protein